MNLKNPAFMILIVVLAMVLSTVGKVYISGKGELKRADGFFAEKKFSQAVTHYERSMGWYLPGPDLQTRAAEGLWKTAEIYENLGEIENALSAYRRLRGGFYSTRSFYTPGRDWIDRCNEKISALMARQPPTSDSEKTKSFEQRKSEILKRLSAEKSPHALWAVVAELGFLGWVTCTFLLIIFAITKSGEMKIRPAFLWGGGFLLFYSLWILGMFKV